MVSKREGNRINMWNPSMQSIKFEFGNPEPIGCLSPRSCRHERLYSGQSLRVLPLHEVQEFLKECPIVTLLLASLLRRSQMSRMFVAEFINGAGFFGCSLCIEKECSGAAQVILHALGKHGSELIREAEIDVITEPGFVRSVVLHRVERCHDVLLASLAVFGRQREAGKMDQQVLCPAFSVLLRRRPVHVSVDPVAHVLREALVKFIEISWYDEPVVSDVSPVNNGDWVERPVFHRKTEKTNGLVFDFRSIALLVETVVAALEDTLLNNLGTDGFTLKLGGFGKFSVRHKAGIFRKIGYTGETILTKDRRKVTFVSLGSLREQEHVI